MIRLLLLLSFLLVAGSAEASGVPRKVQPRGSDGKLALTKRIKDKVRAELGLAAGKRITVEDGFFRANPRDGRRGAQTHEVKFDGIEGFSVNVFEFDGKVSIDLDVNVIVRVPKGKKPPRLPQDGRYKGFGLVKGGTYGDVTDYNLRPY